MSDTVELKTGQKSGPFKAEDRPTSPHLGIWHWHVTMATSILQRATGVANLVGIKLLVLWLLALSLGPKAYGLFQIVVFSVPGKLVLLGLCLSYSFHLFSGIRYLFWDMGKGFEPARARVNSWLIIVIGLLVGVGVFALAFVK